MVTLDEVSRIRMEKAKRNHALYKIVWEQCSKAVTNAVKVSNEQTFTRFVVSPFIPGSPLIDTTRAARYVHDKLVHRGFRVESVDYHPYVVLFISWDKVVEPDALKKTLKQCGSGSGSGSGKTIADDLLRLLAK
jgi:hypothetical protein